MFGFIRVPLASSLVELASKLLWSVFVKHDDAGRRYQTTCIRHSVFGLRARTVPVPKEQCEVRMRTDDRRLNGGLE